ncbi:MAG TPA: glycosyltransferase [Xanthobacteraceae bacterium]|nr:glycosyltransferase [Xanthobacteraceae bacterium]
MIIVNAFAILFAAIAFAACAGILLFIIGKVLFLRLHLSLRQQGLAGEQARLAYRLPADAELPHVVVQLPVYNEGEIVKRAIHAAAALDWPADKLHIQVCDDSTDGTTRLAEEAINALAASDIDIRIVRRAGRDGFKAGSLRKAMECVAYEYFAIFDADYLPPRDFLRRAMPALLSDARCAFVQARAEFLNRDENALTRIQALELDAHYAVEQATRSWAGLPLPFNGTCGIWRRAAIEAGGGWQGKTLAEDMELSYAAWLKGWRGIFITALAVPGELPAGRKEWASQQDRWLTGSAQVIRGFLPAIWQDQRLAGVKRMVALSNIAMWWLSALINTTYIATAFAVLLKPALAPVLLPIVAAILLVLVILQFIELRLGDLLLHGHSRRLSAFAADFAAYLACTVYKLWLHLFSLAKAFFGKKPEFVRTPKRGIGEHGL